MSLRLNHLRIYFTQKEPKLTSDISVGTSDLVPCAFVLKNDQTL